MITLTPQQVEAARSIEKFLRSDDRVFRMHGYAGVGKSSVISAVLGDRSDVTFAAPTAKAASVLRSKGTEAVTLHSLLYTPYEYTHPVTKKPTLGFRPNEKKLLSGVVVADEASMVSARVAEDLLQHPVKVIAIGDPFQLPPVKSAGSLLTGSPDALLTQVHRTALDSPVLELATYIREHGRLPRDFDRGQTKIVSDTREAGDLLDFDQVIIGTHRTRFKATDYLRQLKGRTSRSPEVGDRVICKRNDLEKGLVNGGQFQVKEVLDMGQGVVYTDLKDDDGLHVSTTAWTHGFTGPEGLEKLEEMSFKDRAENTELWYADAITAHASQGSEWDRVLVVDESKTFRQNAAKWIYTAVTRASESVVVVKR